ncbi:MAG: hypothetical protein HOV68_09915 [Streptomycetaceae bacterium]|nr:hypothetical protein [Streptomycetaceae bacterium]
MHEGIVVPSAVVLTHEEQLRRLAEGCPEAVPAGVVAGDPCLDELRASLPFREDYRAAWKLLPGQKLVVVSSTWSSESQFGSAWDVVGHVMATLPRDEFRVAAIVHPNVWYAHSPWQLRSWLAPLQSAGLTVLRPEGDGWKAALVAADAVVGDYGSVTFYGAALGLPTLLSGIPVDGTLAKDSPIAQLLPLLTKVDTRLPLPAQIKRAAERRHADSRIADVTAKATSVPGGSARILRALFYDKMRLPEPAEPVVVQPVELPDDGAFMAPRRSPIPPATMCTAVVEDGVVSLRRYPADLTSRADAHLADAHLVAHACDPNERVRLQADVLVAGAGTPEHDLAAMLRAHPGCWLYALPEGTATCLLGTPTGWRARVTWESDDPRMSVSAAASAVYALLPDGPGAASVSLRFGDLVVPLTVEVLAH